MVRAGWFPAGWLTTLTIASGCAEVVQAASWRRGDPRSSGGPGGRTGRVSAWARPYTGPVPTCTLGANGPPPAARRQRAHLPGLLRAHRPAPDDLEGRARH